MKYFMKTAFGISSRHFMHGYFHKVLGLLQGSADASTIWSINWSVLFNILDKHFCKARFPSPQHHVYKECNGKGFVDNTMLWETSKNDTIQMVVARMEAKAQSWECKIHASGGGLNLLKTFCILSHGNGERTANQLCE